jgi:hypothetical protein
MTYGDFQVYLSFRQGYSGTGASGLLTLPASPPAVVSLTSGSGAGQIQQQPFSVIATATASPVTLDLTTLTGIFGTFGFAGLKMIYFKNLDSTHTISLGGGTDAMPFGLVSATAETVQPGGVIFRVAPATGWTVTSGSTNNLLIDPGANTVAYELFLVGV